MFNIRMSIAAAKGSYHRHDPVAMPPKALSPKELAARLKAAQPPVLKGKAN